MGFELDKSDGYFKTFDLSPSKLSLSVKSQPNMNRLGPKGLNSQTKIVCLITDSILQSRYLPFMHL